MRKITTYILVVLTITCAAEVYAQDKVKFINLGLPSGTLWADCNVGSKNSWDIGYYFAWGETAPKTEYTWETYKYCNGKWNGMTKYCAGDKYCAIGHSDSLKQLELADDAAHATYGGNCIMPTQEDWKELFATCYWLWTDDYKETSVPGYIVYRAKCNADKGVFDTSIIKYTYTDTHIFLPAGGVIDQMYDKVAPQAKGTHGLYWANTLSGSCSNNGNNIMFLKGIAGCDGTGREEGLSVRAVKKSKPSNKVK